MSKNTRHLFFAAILIVILVSLNFLGNNFLRKIFLTIIEKPSLFLTEKFFELKAFTFSLINYSVILEENENLYLKNYELLAEKGRLASLEEKYNQLKKQFSLASPKVSELEPAKIFLFSYGPGGAGAFIDKGEESGIAKGQAVIYGGNVLIGIIEETFSRQSRVMLITDPNFRANTRTSDKTQALANGAMEKGLVLEFIAAEDSIKKGDLLFTNGLDGLPENLLVGKVGKVEPSGGGLFKKIFIEPSFVKERSIHVFVIIQ